MAGVYISYPFCAQKCTYCNFASGVYRADLEGEYLEALLAEVAAHRWQWRPETLYLGGGTPSRLEEANLARLLGAVPGFPWREATIEAAPGTVTAAGAQAWRQAGITRVSLGVQSFVPGEIARTGRRHTPKIVEQEVELLRAAGLGSINIDLIAGLPGQTMVSWNESLDWIAKLGPGHVSVYMLEVDEDSRLGRELLAGGARYGAAGAPSDEETAEFYELAVERLAALGIARYEISNFARPGHESLHNMKYWRLEAYAGFGADAHSFDGVLRRGNVETAEAYVDRWRRGYPVYEDEAPARPDQERFFISLRLAEGIAPRPEEWRLFDQPISRFLAEGLLERHGDQLRLTRRGVLLSNEIFQEFVIP